MPKLGARQTERVYLPSTNHLPESERAWVELYSDITVGETAAIRAMQLDDVREGIEILRCLIADWNFTEDGTSNTSKMPITSENVDDINKNDYVFLSTKYAEYQRKAEEGLSNDEKKASTGSSTQESDKPKSQPITINYNS